MRTKPFELDRVYKRTVHARLSEPKKTQWLNVRVS